MPLRPESTRALAPLAVACLCLAIGPTARADDRGEMAERVERLERDVAELRARAAGDWLTETRADEIRAIAEDVLADAESRASLLDDDIVAGWDDGFVIRDGAERFELEISGQIQVRWIYNRRDIEFEDEDPDQYGFEMRRSKIKLDGYILEPGYHYTVKGGFSRRTGHFELQDANIEIPLGDGMKVRTGRFRSPLLREEHVSSKRQLLVERSLIAKAFRQDRTTGLALIIERERVAFIAAYMDASDGLIIGGDESNLVSARAEILLDGSRGDLKDFTSFPGDEPAAALGLGALYQNVNRSDADVPDTELFRWTADLSVEFGGANLFAAFVGNHTDAEDLPTLDQYGVVVQGGVFVAEDWEAFAQYVWGDADGPAPDLSVVTLGLNGYVAEHDLKFTIDAGYAFNQVGAFWQSTGAGWVEDEEGKDGQVVVRTQLQLLF